MLSEPEDCEDLSKIDERYVKTLDGDLFLQANIQTKEGVILLFVSAQHLRLLGQASIWIVDGTFSTAPRQFTQVFTIHGSVGQDNVRRFVPMAYMLLPRKNEGTYDKAFSTLVELGEKHGFQLDPDFILLDFETAVMNAAKKVFPTASLHGCFFHLNQSFFRKLKQLGHQTLYASDYRVQLFYKQIVALAFLPHQEIPKAFEELRKTGPKILDDFVSYVGEYYVCGRKALGRKTARRAIFPPALWSVFDNTVNGIPRTTNNIEGWHNKWNGLWQKRNLTFYSVLKQFQLEERNASTEILRALQAQPVAKKSKKTAENNEKLEKLVLSYEPGNSLNYLTGIALVLINK